MKPDAAEAHAIVARVLPVETSAQQRRELADSLERFADARVERYWQLLGILNGWPPFQPQVPAFRWLLAALRAHG